MSRVCHAILAHPKFTIGVNCRGIVDGDTALHVAVTHGLPSVCEAIMEHPSFEALNARQTHGKKVVDLDSAARILAAIARL